MRDTKSRATKGPQFDVAVIGAGIGGLTTASLLARRGLSVVVFEKRDVPGGCCSAYVHDGYQFDIASSLFYGFGETGFNANRRVLDELGVELEMFDHDPCFSFVFEGERIGVDRDLSAWIDQLGRRFPSCRPGIEQFYADIEVIFWQTTKVGFMPLADARLTQLARMAFGDPSIVMSYLPLLKRTVWDYLEPRLLKGGAQQDELRRFKALLDVDLSFGTCSPSHELPLLVGVPILMDRHIGGVSYPKGGSAAIADKLVEGLERHGGSIRYGTEVEEIIVDNGRVCGIVAHGETIRARQVVCNANVWALYQDLLPKPAVSRSQARRVRDLTASRSAFITFVAMDAEDLPSDATPHGVSVTQTDDVLDHVCITYVPSMDDPDLAPEGKHAVTLVTLVDQKSWSFSRDPEVQERERQAHLERALRLARPLYPNIDAGDVVGTMSPSDLESQLGRRRGAVSGPEQNLAQSLTNRHGNRTDVDGLFLVGDSTFPGEGVVAVTISGLTCADMVAEEARPLRKSA